MNAKDQFNGTSRSAICLLVEEAVAVHAEAFHHGKKRIAHDPREHQFRCELRNRRRYRGQRRPADLSAPASRNESGQGI